ncbi:uncharacterized protein LOC119310579 [Triticum dicoccoides]|uniref:uncharacterized protein LOC119310579 n=1 Tax=Triticum dicoccoides TaxID=85692 RepID=UPI001891EB5C|nr:uncharacterized protein LOC119310579 [Triticum dicoccoides]
MGPVNFWKGRSVTNLVNCPSQYRLIHSSPCIPRRPSNHRPASLDSLLPRGFQPGAPCSGVSPPWKPSAAVCRLPGNPPLRCADPARCLPAPPPPAAASPVEQPVTPNTGHQSVGKWIRTSGGAHLKLAGVKRNLMMMIAIKCSWMTLIIIVFQRDFDKVWLIFDSMQSREFRKLGFSRFA